jgi:hypothetical protein
MWVGWWVGEWFEGDKMLVGITNREKEEEEEEEEDKEKEVINEKNKS